MRNLFLDNLCPWWGRICWHRLQWVVRWGRHSLLLGMHLGIMVKSAFRFGCRSCHHMWSERPCIQSQNHFHFHRYLIWTYKSTEILAVVTMNFMFILLPDCHVTLGSCHKWRDIAVISTEFSHQWRVLRITIPYLNRVWWCSLAVDVIWWWALS